MRAGPTGWWRGICVPLTPGRAFFRWGTQSVWFPRFWILPWGRLRSVYRDSAPKGVVHRDPTPTLLSVMFL